MKLVFRGYFKNESQLPKGVLPSSAVKFREPQTKTQSLVLSLVLALFMSILIIAITVAIELFWRGGEIVYTGDGPVMDILNLVPDFTTLGVVFALIALIPHELLHAVCFGKGAEVEMFFKSTGAFVTSTKPISKNRFIFLSLLPNVVFGVIPLILWAVLPYNAAYSSHLHTFATAGLVIGVGDYVNVFNALRQMPKGSIQQLSGSHSYWFTSTENKTA